MPKKSSSELTDAALLALFREREQAWLTVLAQVRQEQEASLGKPSTPIHWLADRGVGTHAWLGYFWKDPLFWFGYGLHPRGWGVLVEAELSRCPSGWLDNLQRQMPGVWAGAERTGPFFRLWAGPADQAGSVEDGRWLSERGREIHEFAVDPAAG